MLNVRVGHAQNDYFEDNLCGMRQSTQNRALALELNSERSRLTKKGTKRERIEKNLKKITNRKRV